MSQAQPMSTDARAHLYMWRPGQTPSVRMPTPRQQRRLDRKRAIEQLRDAGDMRPHGATGERIRRPIVRTSLIGEMRGSLVTHVAEHCAPCPEHAPRPRLHRSPVGSTPRGSGRR